MGVCPIEQKDAAHKNLAQSVICRAPSAAADTSTCRLESPFLASTLFCSLEASTRVLEAARLSTAAAVTVDPLHLFVASVQMFATTVSDRNDS